MSIWNTEIIFNEDNLTFILSNRVLYYKLRQQIYYLLSFLLSSLNIELYVDNIDRYKVTSECIIVLNENMKILNLKDGNRAGGGGLLNFGFGRGVRPQFLNNNAKQLSLDLKRGSRELKWYLPTPNLWELLNQTFLKFCLKWGSWELNFAKWACELNTFLKMGH